MGKTATRILGSCIACVLASPGPAHAASVEIFYASIERMIDSAVLVSGGRLYLKGGPEDSCSYAFVQEPRVSASGGRLALRFLFAGSLGKRVRGKCVGSGDNFDVVVSGIPDYAAGELFLADMKVAGESRVFNLFSSLIESTLGPRLRLPLQRIVSERIQGWSGSSGRVALEALDVSGILLDENALRVVFDLRVSLAP